MRLNRAVIVLAMCVPLAVAACSRQPEKNQPEMSIGSELEIKAYDDDIHVFELFSIRRAELKGKFV